MSAGAKRFRIVLAFEVDAPNIETAYANLCEHVGSPTDKIVWTTTNEWTDYHGAGSIDHETVRKTIYNYWCKPEE